MKKIEDYLKKSGYANFLNARDLYRIDSDKLKGVTFSKLNEMFKFYILIDGYADAYYPDKLGKSHLVGRIYSKNYQIGGLHGYFGRKYSNLNDYHIKFSKNTALYRIDAKKINKLMKNNSFLKFLLDKNIEFLSNSTQENYLKSVFNPEEYIAYILYNHSDNNEYIVENYFEFSSLIKCSRSTIYKALKGLEDEGAIDKDGKTIKIRSKKKLKFIFEEKV